ncbi:MAG: hypothetical protein H6743_03685 [Rickettsiaceae bacterium]|nr:hypothetical protein [Rickettsiaceae bacterium]
MLNLNEEIKNIDGSLAMQNFTKPGFELDEDGKPTIEHNDFRVVVLKDLLLKALSSTLLDDEKSVSKKVKQYELLKKIQFVDEVELTKEEKELLTYLVGRHYQVLFAGQAIELINK